MGTASGPETHERDLGSGRNAGTGIESVRRPADVRSPRTRPDGRTGRRERDALANALGWFSIGLGVAQVVAPRGVARLIGVRDDDRTIAVMRACGIRELTSGIGILSQPTAPGWMWSRVAGDAIDLALLGRALGAGATERNRTTAATVAVLGVTALDILAGTRPGREGEPAGEAGIHVTRSITVNRPVEEVYAFWRDFENLPRFMRHLESVAVLGDGRSHWKATAPTGKPVEWDAEMTTDVPNELIAWRSVEGADVPNDGSVRFRRAPGGRGTEVTVELFYRPPGGVIAAQIAKLFRKEPGQQVADDLRAFKQVMEIGEVVRSDATIERGTPHAARPPEHPVSAAPPA